MDDKVLYSSIAFDLNVSFISERDGIVTDVSDSFLKLSGFNREDMMYKPFDFVWSQMLRISKKRDFSDAGLEAFLFTKSLDAICVMIEKNTLPDSNEAVYYIEEIPGSGIGENNQFLERLIVENNIGIGIFSADDFMLIKANATYLSYLPEPFNKKEMFYGRCFKDAIPDFEGSHSEKMWIEAVKNNKIIRFKEKQTIVHVKEGRYWNYSLTPVSVNGEVKYVVVMVEDVTEQVMSRERARKQSELINKQNKRLDVILENMSDALYVFDREGNCTLSNKASYKMMGEEIYKKAQDRYRPGVYFDLEDREIPYDEMAYSRALRGEKTTEQIMKIKLPIGIRYAGVSATPLFDESGEVEQVVLCVRDITATQSESQIIREQKMELEAIIDNINDAIFIYDSNRNCFLTNKSAKAFIPDKKAEKLDNAENVFKFYDMEGIKVPLNNLPMEKLYRGEMVKNEKLTLKNDKIARHMSINGITIYDNQGNIKLVTISCRDITQDIEMQRLVTRQKEELEAVIENMDDAIFIYDKNFDFYMMNKVAREYYPDVILKRYSDSYIAAKYYDADDNEIPWDEMTISRVQRGEKIKNRRIRMVQGNSVRYSSVSGMPVYDIDNSIRLGILHIHDITEDINRERIIKEQQDVILKREIEKGEALREAMELKDEFLYLITHEFRTPMAVVNSALQVINLTCKEEVTERVGRYLGIIKQNTNRQLRLVNNLLDITRISSGNIKMNISRFDAVHVIETIIDSIKFYAEQKNVNIYFNSTLEEKYIYSDDEKLERIILNLLSNALKFTPGGKSIFVSLSEKRYKHKKLISIDVRDEGIGIPKEKQETIFERFGQVDSSLSRRAEGTGLGLHLVKLLVDALGGEVKVQSKVDSGSTFSVMLPEGENEAADESIVSRETINKSEARSDRVIESAAIEFSDIYF